MMGNIISELFHSTNFYVNNGYKQFHKFIEVIQLINPNYIDFENSYFGFETTNNCFIIKLVSKNNTHLQIEIVMDFEFKTVLYKIGKCPSIEETYGRDEINLEVPFAWFLKQLNLEFKEKVYFSSANEIVKGYYLTTEQRKIWYKWTFSFFRKLTFKDFTYQKWI